MGAVERYLRAIESRLRCPAERQASVVEELRAHLEDRAEALQRQDFARQDAERRAVREMGPAWKLALRLSMANGWRLAPYLVRQVWATSLGMVLLVVSLPMTTLYRMPMVWQVFKLACAISAAFVFMFGFGLAQIVRGWRWAAIPALLVAPSWLFGGDRSPLDTGFSLMAICLCAGALIGGRPGVPHRPRVAWLSAGGAVTWGLIWTSWCMRMPGSWMERPWPSRLLDSWLDQSADAVFVCGIIALLSWALMRGLEWYGQRKPSSAATA